MNSNRPIPPGLPEDPPEIVNLQYKTLESGIHVFTSKEMPGLHHAHKDYLEAIRTLPLVAEDLVRLQYGVRLAYRFSDDGQSLISIPKTDVN